MRQGLLAFTLALAAGGCIAPLSDREDPRVAVGGSSSLAAAFVQVGAETGVPAELLAALSYVETRFEIVDAHAHGHASLGLLGLSPEELAFGAALAGETDLAARTQAVAGLRAGAMLIKERAPGARSLEDYLAAFDDELRDELTTLLARGVDAGGVTIAARPSLDRTTGDGGFGSVTQALGNADYGPALWNAAYSGNYQTANRTKVDHIVIHDTEGSYTGTISWFKNASSNVSAHYVIKSSNGEVTQMVKEKDVAWHDACFNTTTVGIEHEGYAAMPDKWFTEAMYVSSAKLSAYLADKYGIPKERGFIVGHGEAPDCSDHTDPGPGWNWAHYIDLVKTGGAPMFLAGDAMVDGPITLTSGERTTVTVTISNTGNAAWDLDATRLGTAAPQDRESAFFVDGDWISTNRATAVDAKVEPGATGTFTFEVIAPEVREPTLFDEGFQLVQEGTTWFGPEVHVVFNVVPEGEDGGCSAGGGGSGASACAMLLVGALVSRRRRRRARGL